jgi:Lrp/AsnC family leucine-responsive transcriptional regulator
MKIKRTLDRTDIRILAELQRNARMAVVDLAAKVNLSPTPCTERVRNLERLGFITGYKAQLNANLLGLPFMAIVEAKLNDSGPEFFEKFKRSIQAIPEILSCEALAGDCDVMVRCRTTDASSFNQLLSAGLRPLRGQLSVVRVHIVLEELKEPGVIPLDDRRQLPVLPADTVCADEGE